MKQEDIEAIRKAQAELRKIEDQKRAEWAEWEKNNLTPLVIACDHTYPWGESAWKSDLSTSDRRCHICGTVKWGIMSLTPFS
jgi:hypothetical protein